MKDGRIREKKSRRNGEKRGGWSVEGMKRGRDRRKDE